MAVSLRAAGTWSERTTNTTVAIPAGSVAGDRMYLLASWKDFAITASVSGWTELVEGADGSVGTGNGSGSMKVGVWYKDHSGSESNPTLTFSTTTGLLATAVIVTFQKGANDAWDTPVYTSAGITNWTTTAQTVTAGATSFPGAAGVVIGVAGIRDDSATFTRPTTGIGSSAGTITWSGNYVESPATHFSTTTGNDMAADAGHRFFTGASGSVTLTQTATLSAAETGMAIWVIQTVTPQGTFGQVAFRGRNDDGSESGATWKAAQNTNWTQDTDEVFRARFEIQESGGVAQEQDYRIMFNKNGGSYAAVGTSGTAVVIAASPNVADGEATTNQLTAGTGTFTAGEIDETNTVVQAKTIAASGHTELEFVLKIDPAQVADGDTIGLRVYKGTTATPVALNSYAQTPTITVNKPDRVTTTTRISLGNPGTPGAGNRTLIVRARAAIGGGTLRVQVYEGATQRDTFDHTLTSSFQNFSRVISGVTDVSNLEIRLQGLATNGYQLRPQVSWVRWSVPAAAGPPQIAIPAGLTLTPVFAVKKIAPRTIAATVTLTPVVQRKKFDLEQVTATMSAVVSLVRKKLTTISADLSLTGGLAMRRTHLETVASTLSLTPVISKFQIRPKTIAANLTMGSALLRTKLQPQAHSLVLTPILNRKLFRVVVAGLTGSPAISFARLKLMTVPAGLTLTPAMNLLKAKSLAVTVTLSPVISRVMKAYRVLSAGLTLNTVLNRRQNRTQAATLNTNPALSAVKSKFIDVPVTLTLTSTITRRVTVLRTLAADLVLNPVMNRRLGKTVAAGLTVSPVILTKKTLYRVIAASLNVQPSIQFGRLSLKPLAVGLTAAAQIQLIRITHIQIAPGLVISTALSRRLQKQVNAALNMAGDISLTTQGGIPLAATLSLGVNVLRVKYASRALSASLTLDTALTRLKVAPRLLAAVVSLGAVLTKGKTRSLDANLTLTPVITLRKVKFVAIASNLVITQVVTRLKIAARTLSAGLNLTSVITRRPARTLNATVTPTVGMQQKKFKFLSAVLQMPSVIARGGDNIALEAQIVMQVVIDRAGKKLLEVPLAFNVILRFQRFTMKFRDWLFSTKMSEPVLESAELDQPELVSAITVSED